MRLAGRREPWSRGGSWARRWHGSRDAHKAGRGLRRCPCLGPAPSGSFQAAAGASDRTFCPFSRGPSRRPGVSRWRRGHTASAGGTPRASSRCMSLGSRGASPCLHHRKWKSRPGRGQDLSPGTLAPTGRQRQDPGGDTRDTTLCPRCQGHRGSFPTPSCPPSGTDFSNSQQLMVKIRLKRHPCRRPGRGAPCRSRTPREGPGRLASLGGPATGRKGG